MPRQFPRVKDGDALTPRHLNLIYAELERLNRLQVAGGSFQNGPSPLITVGPAASRMATLVRSPAGGIAAISGTTPGAADCDVYEWDGTDLTLGAEDIEVLNRWDVAIGASKEVLAVKYLGAWWAENWECD